MAWTTTAVDSYWVGNPGKGHPRLVTVNDCVYSGTGYGGAILNTGFTGATGPTKSDLGFTGTTDASFSVISVVEVPNGKTGGIYGRRVGYDTAHQQLIVGATAATDISDVTYRVTAIGVYGP